MVRSIPLLRATPSKRTLHDPEVSPQVDEDPLRANPYPATPMIERYHCPQCCGLCFFAYSQNLRHAFRLLLRAPAHAALHEELRVT